MRFPELFISDVILRASMELTLLSAIFPYSFLWNPESASEWKDLVWIDLPPGPSGASPADRRDGDWRPCLTSDRFSRTRTQVHSCSTDGVVPLQRRPLLWGTSVEQRNSSLLDVSAIAITWTNPYEVLFHSAICDFTTCVGCGTYEW